MVTSRAWHTAGLRMGPSHANSQQYYSTTATIHATVKRNLANSMQVYLDDQARHPVLVLSFVGRLDRLVQKAVSPS